MKKRAREHVNQVALDWDENESDEAAKTSKGAYSFFFLLQAFRSFISNGVPWTASYAGYSAQQASQERLRRRRRQIRKKFEKNR